MCAAVRGDSVGDVALLSVIPLAAAPRLLVFHPVYITDVNDNSFVVSWTTDEASAGQVDWGTAPESLTTTTADLMTEDTTTHYVIIGGLTSGETYYFQVRSGGETDDNGGAYYSVTTGPTLGLPGSKTVWGYAYASDGTTPLPNAIVYLCGERGQFAVGERAHGKRRRLGVHPRQCACPGAIQCYFCGE